MARWFHFRLAQKNELSRSEFVEALQRVPGVKHERTAERFLSWATEFQTTRRNVVQPWALPAHRKNLTNWKPATRRL